MEINICSGECLKEILEKKYNVLFVPFNEAMNKGSYSSKLFSEDFIIERSNTHNVSVEEYKYKLKFFLDFLNNISSYNKVILWFGDDDFCKANLNILLNTLNEYKFNGLININIVDELTGDILYK